MSKNKKSGKKRTTKNLGDITINDFANSSTAKSRPKKSISNVTHVLKQLESEKTWDEKTDLFEGDFDFVEEENEDGTVSYVIRKVESRSRKKTCSTSEDKLVESTGNEYPLDIWFLISEYVRPEDVGRFAGICKASYSVVCTAKFWFTLYRRYYNSVPNLPERLQPECMFRLYGLRTSVVRALYYMYPPFSSRLKAITSFEQHPDILRKRQCVLMWHEKKKSQWCFYFKLQEHRNNSLSHSRNTEKPDLLEMLEDVRANQDENCRILQVTCSHFIPVPPVIGLTLNFVTLSLSQGCRHYRLQLGFGSAVCSSKAAAADGAVIVLDPVVNVKVLDWWHPSYPHDYSMQSLLNSE